MGKKKFVGILLVLGGVVLVLVGLMGRFFEFGENQENNVSDLAEVEIEKEMKQGNLVVSLPVPQSIVASPLLVRGKVYGKEDAVSLSLLTNGGEVLVRLDTMVQGNDLGMEAKLFQASLVFEDSGARKGVLQIRLMTDDGRIADEEVIPVVLGNNE